jgi:hypothetical protein
MDDLFELRFYVAKPHMFAIFRNQWMTVHLPIYSDYHDVLGLFEVLRSEPHPESGETSAGIGLFLRHDDRAAVDRSMNELIKSNRMNEVPGPPGRDLVDHWERTFLYPLAQAESDEPADTHDTETVFELRSWLTTDDGLGPLTDEADRLLAGLTREHQTERLFASHPEHAEMPDGIAALIRHPDLSAAMTQSDAQVIAELRDIAGPALAGYVSGGRRLMLRPLPNSPMS